MSDLIDRQAAIDALREAEKHAFNGFYQGIVKAHNIIADLPPAQKTGKWIPIKTRPITEEEQEVYPDLDFIIESELPENGQDVLLTCYGTKRNFVLQDTYYNDSGCYFESGFEPDGEYVLAWMPLPEPYKGDKNE